MEPNAQKFDTSNPRLAHLEGSQTKVKFEPTAVASLSAPAEDDKILGFTLAVERRKQEQRIAN